MGSRRKVFRGFWRLARFLEKPRAEQDAILRVAMERAAAEARASANRPNDWTTYDGSVNWIDR